MLNKAESIVSGYLCSDGMVKQYKNPSPHYYIKFTNIESSLIKDFDSNFTLSFGIKPRHQKEKNIIKSIIQNKRIFEEINKWGTFGSFDWEIPKVGKNITYWLRAFFDGEAWVENQIAKNRSVRLDCANLKGLKQIQLKLKNLGINSRISKRKGRNIYRLDITGKDNLIKYQKKIGFLHPKKLKKLEGAINSFINYKWKIAENNLITFLKKKGKKQKNRNETRFFSIIKDNLIKVRNLLKKRKINSRLLGPWKNKYSIYYCLCVRTNDLEALYGHK